MLASLIFANLVIFLLGSYALSENRQQEERRAEVVTQNLALALDQSLSASVRQIDFAVHDVVDGLEQQLRRRPQLEAAEVASLLAHNQEALSSFARISVSDATGLPRYVSELPATPRASFAERPFFQDLRRNPKRDLIITQPSREPGSSAWTISLVRRYNRPDGDFAGVVAATLPLEYFSQLLSGLDLGSNGMAVLRGADTALIARYPQVATATQQLGTKVFSPELAQLIAAGASSGSYHSKQTGDSIERSNSYRRLFALPFHLVVGLATDDYLANWREAQTKLIAAMLAFLAITSLLTWQLWRAFSSLRQASEELVHHRQHLETMLSERTQDLLRTNAELSRARDAAESGNRAKSSFLAHMSHEIRNPLNAIIGMGNIMKRDSASPIQAERLDKIGTAAGHLLGIIDDILDLSKIEADKLSLSVATLDVEAIVANVATMIHDRAAAKGLSIRIDNRAPHSPLLGDATRLQQALLNYAGNALKFTERGGITLCVTQLAEDADSVLLRFEVQDSGVGIDTETLSRLFTSFEQADNATTRRHGGTGLGLAITRQLARLMGGDAGAQSTPGLGSSFWFSARLGKTDAPHANPAATGEGPLSAEATLQQRAQGGRILVVDDDALNREVAQILLEDIGLQVDVAADGVEALSLAQNGGYNLILMDVQMPNMDGLEATRKLRQIPACRDLPILAMTANTFSADRQRCLDAGMNDFIGKPFQPQTLFETLLVWYKGKGDAGTGNH